MMMRDFESVPRAPFSSTDSGTPAWRPPTGAGPARAGHRGSGPSFPERYDSAVNPHPARSDHARRAVDFLGLIESHGLTGAWSWSFEDGDHAWSPGCYYLLGVDPRGTHPTYGLLLDLVHPEDRSLMAGPSDLMRGEARPGRKIRVIRPDGTMRILLFKDEIKHGPDGRPRSVLGTLLDVTDRERSLRTQSFHRQHMRDVNRRAGIVSFVMRLDRTFDFDSDAADLLGCPLQSLNADLLAFASAEGRGVLAQSIADQQAAGSEVRCDLVLHPPGGAPKHCRIVMVPASGGSPVSSWTGVLQVLDGPASSAPARDGDREVLDLRGFHLRAARALLDWSMHDLAAASGLSLSTVRRIEDDDEASPGRSRPRAVSALRKSGVVFLRLSDGTLAVSRQG